MRFILGAIMAAAIAGCFSDGVGVTCVRHGPMYGDWGYRHHFYRDFDRPYWWGGY